jgi:hypothetical protein
VIAAIRCDFSHRHTIVSPSVAAESKDVAGKYSSFALEL